MLAIAQQQFERVTVLRLVIALIRQRVKPFDLNGDFFEQITQYVGVVSLIDLGFEILHRLLLSTQHWYSALVF